MNYYTAHFALLDLAYVDDEIVTVLPEILPLEQDFQERGC